MTTPVARVAVAGAGAMGGIIGAGLARGGVDVTLVDTWAAHVEAIDRDGVRIVSADGEEAVPVRATTSMDDVGPVDLLIVLVKAQQTENVMRTAGSLLAHGAAVLSLQNGIGNEDVIAAAVGAGRTLGGSIYFGGSVQQPGVIHCSARDADVVVGAIDRAGRTSAEDACRLLRRGGFNAKIHDDILAVKWRKVIVNVGINAMTGVLGLPSRIAADRPEIREAMVAACAEALAVARAKDVPLIGGDDPAHYVGSGVDVHDYRHKASMCRDIEAGRPTEIEFINGAIVRMGRELGIPTPVNTVLTAAIRSLERKSE